MQKHDEIDFRSWRSRLAWTQQEAADYLGVAIQTYRDWEQGRGKPKVVKPIKVMMEQAR